MSVLRRAIWMNQSEVKLQFNLFSGNSFFVPIEALHVVRVNAASGFLPRHRATPWVKPENPECFRRPVDDFLTVEIPSPASRVAQPLRFSQVTLAPPQCLLGASALSNIAIDRVLSDLAPARNGDRNSQQ